MSGNEPITEASVREYLIKNNGKVKNVDLITHFRQQLNDPVNKSKLLLELLVCLLHVLLMSLFYCSLRQSKGRIHGNCAYDRHCPNDASGKYI